MTVASNPALAAAGGKPSFVPTQEMRFAVVLYGGSSLAIYINGVVQELLHLVRATAPRTPPTDQGYSNELLLRNDELSGSERVYRRLGQLLSWEQRTAALEGKPADESAPVQTRFIVDILSGTSAGGINGIFLAKALANGDDISRLRQLWFDEGDIARLLYDQASYQGVHLQEQPPNSLLNSRRMYSELLGALRGMSSSKAGSSTDAGAAEVSRLVDELDLWITATDIRGLLLAIGLWDRVVYEKRYRNVFRFSYANPYSDPDAEVRNDFVRANDPLLAFAARCTSSFPFAFDPMELEDIDPIVVNEDFEQDYGSRGLDSSHAEWSRFFPDYLPSAAGGDLWYRRQAFGDGGYLDNKPFTWATSALQRRRADLPVDRKLLYIEPDPGGVHALQTSEGHPGPRPKPPAQQVSPDKPDALANTRAALLDLPRKEAIRDDLEALLQRNRDLGRLERIITAVDIGDIDKWTMSAAEWATKAPTEHYADLHYAAYNRLKVATVLDDLAEVATIVAGFDAESDERSAIRCFVQAWYGFTKRDQGAAQAKFLLDFDLPYRLRRLQFLQDRIDELLRGDPTPLEMLGEQGDAALTVRNLDKDALLQLKRELNGVLVRVRGVRRALRRRDKENPIASKLHEAPISHDQLIEVLWEARSQDESDRRALAKLEHDPNLAQAVDGVAEAVGTELAKTFTDPNNDVRAILARSEQIADGAFLRFYDAYEAYDSIMLPISYGVTGESDRVEVIRISPEDATGIVDEVKGRCRKLAGIQYGHFGGFLKREWRENDFMWGRLDAADRLITALLPAATADDEHRDEWASLRDELRQMAFHAILAEERPSDCASQEGADAYMAKLHADCEQGGTGKDRLLVKTKLGTVEVLGIAGRAGSITHKILDGVETNVLTGPLIKGISVAAAEMGLLARGAKAGIEAEHWLGRFAGRVRKVLRLGK
jgi:patatin-related protein